MQMHRYDGIDSSTRATLRAHGKTRDDEVRHDEARLEPQRRLASNDARSRLRPREDRPSEPCGAPDGAAAITHPLTPGQSRAATRHQRRLTEASHRTRPPQGTQTDAIDAEHRLRRNEPVAPPCSAKRRHVERCGSGWCHARRCAMLAPRVPEVRSAPQRTPPRLLRRALRARASHLHGAAARPAKLASHCGPVRKP